MMFGASKGKHSVCNLYFILSVLLSLLGTVLGFSRFSHYRSELLLTGVSTDSMGSRLLIWNLITAFLFAGSYFSCVLAVTLIFFLLGFSFLNTYAISCFLLVQKSLSFPCALLICFFYAFCQFLLCISCLKNAELCGKRFVKSILCIAADDRKAFFIHALLTVLFFAAVLLQFLIL